MGASGRAVLDKQPGGKFGLPSSTRGEPRLASEVSWLNPGNPALRSTSIKCSSFLARRIRTSPTRRGKSKPCEQKSDRGRDPACPGRYHQSIERDLPSSNSEGLPAIVTNPTPENENTQPPLARIHARPLLALSVPAGSPRFAKCAPALASPGRSPNIRDGPPTCPGQTAPVAPMVLGNPRRAPTCAPSLKAP
jgi:hypothetical protein